MESRRSRFHRRGRGVGDRSFCMSWSNYLREYNYLSLDDEEDLVLELAEIFDVEVI